MRTCCILLFSGLLLSAPVFSQPAAGHAIEADTNYTPRFTAGELVNKLEEISKANQKDSLALFFSNWNKAIPPNSTAFITQNDTTRAIFDIYRVFYKPLDLLKLGDWEWGNKLNSYAAYIVVPNTIVLQFLPTDTVDIEKYTNIFGIDDERDKDLRALTDFRPPLDINKSMILYLADEYESALNHFLGGQSTPVGEGNIMNPSLPAGESERRYNLIRPYIPVLHGHWGGYWHLSTHPEVSRMIFNRQLTMAVINFRVGYQGGIAVLRKQRDGWKLEKSNTTWIE